MSIDHASQTIPGFIVRPNRRLLTRVYHNRFTDTRSLIIFLIIGLVFLQAATVGAILLTHYVRSEQAINDHVQTILTSVAGETFEHAAAYLKPGENVVDVTRGLIESGKLDLDDLPALQSYFLNQLHTATQYDGLFYGDKDGKFFFVKHDTTVPGAIWRAKTVTKAGDGQLADLVWLDGEGKKIKRQFDSEDVFDPRPRLWYQLAAEADTVVWTNSYVFYSSKRPGITVAAPVHGDDGMLTGVVGLDVAIDKISDFIAQRAAASRVNAFVINWRGEAIGLPNMEDLLRPAGDEFRLARIHELDDPVVGAIIERMPVDKSGGLSLATDEKRSINVDVNGERYFAHLRPFEPSSNMRWPWTIGVYVAQEDFIEPIRESQRQSAMLAIVIGAVVTLLAFTLALFFLKPVIGLQHQVDHEPLTGLLNRRGLRDLATSAFSQSPTQPVATIMIDIDRFKQINDTYGHAVGDEVLKAVANRLKGSLAHNDLLCRYGGEEFAALLVGQTIATATMVAERLRDSVSAKPIQAGDRLLRVTISAGVAATTVGDFDLDRLLDRADTAMLQAKRAGRDQVLAAA